MNVGRPLAVSRCFLLSQLALEGKKDQIVSPRITIIKLKEADSVNHGGEAYITQYPEVVRQSGSMTQRHNVGAKVSSTLVTNSQI